MPPNFTDQWGNKYQDVTVQTATGNVSGQKASKNELTQNDINSQVEWECEVKQDKRGQNYNRFTKPQDPQYASQNRSQSPQNAPQSTNAPTYSKDTSIERQCAFKSACHRAQGTVMKSDEIIELARQGHHFIETGYNIAPGKQVEKCAKCGAEDETQCSCNPW